MINVHEGTKDRLPTNVERVRLLDERPPPKIQEALREYQISGQPRLAASIQGYTDNRGRQMYSLPYYPNPDPTIESRHAYEHRGSGGKAQKILDPLIFQTKYTYVSLEIGHLVICTYIPDGYMQTYWTHNVTLAYLAASEDRWRRELTENLHDIVKHLFRYSKGGLASMPLLSTG